MTSSHYWQHGYTSSSPGDVIFFSVGINLEAYSNQWGQCQFFDLKCILRWIAATDLHYLTLSYFEETHKVQEAMKIKLWGYWVTLVAVANTVYNWIDWNFISFWLWRCLHLFWQLKINSCASWSRDSAVVPGTKYSDWTQSQSVNLKAVPKL